MSLGESDELQNDSQKILESKKNIDENELLTNLVEQFGLNDFGKFDSRRSAIWIDITDHFNKVTGQNRTVQQIRNRWKNYR